MHAADPPKAAPPPRAEVAWISRSGEVQTATQFTRPSAVDCAADGRCLVADKSANQVIVYGADGVEQKRLEVGLPEDADFLGSGYLITSARDKAVLELDEDGSIVWRYDALSRPLDADRLANGNTLIADAHPPRILEVDRAGKIVWSHEEGLLLPWDVELAPDGNVLVADYNRHEVRCIRRDGSTCWRVNHIGHPSALHVLDDGTFLVSAHKAGSILHIGHDRRILGHWPIGRDLEDFAVDIEGTGGLLGTLLGRRERLLVAQMMRADVTASSRTRRAAGLAILEHLRSGVATASDAVAGVRVASQVDTAGKNVVVILFDSLRFDHVPWHGYWRNTAPYLAEMARRGLVFDQFIMQAPWTKPAVASLLTSTHASVHGAISQTPDSQLPMSLVTMAEALSAAGYFTAAVMQNPHMGDRNSSKGFEQGYARYVYLGKTKEGEDATAEMASTAAEILEARPLDSPFFLTVFFLNPHYPYEAAHKAFGDVGDGPSNPGPINDYDAEILEADEQVGRLLSHLAAAGLADDTIVVFTSDHGEEFGDHGKRFHGDTLYDCVIRTPLAISGLDRVGRFPGLVRSIDLLPTLLDYLGVPPTAELGKQMAGVSIRPFLEPGIERSGLIAYSQSRFRDDVHLVAERSETRKVIADFKAKRAQVFDLLADPQEYDDLADDAVSTRELDRLQRWELRQGAAPPDEGPSEPIPEEVLERLRAAGYLGE